MVVAVRDCFGLGEDIRKLVRSLLCLAFWQVSRRSEENEISTAIGMRDLHITGMYT
jgi:hypothetical protein